MKDIESVDPEYYNSLVRGWSHLRSKSSRKWLCQTKHTKGSAIESQLLWSEIRRGWNGHIVAGLKVHQHGTSLL
jgi:hypothetical protein